MWENRNSKNMELIIGTHERTIDDKGRLSLPSAFREKLGERCVLSQLQDSKCVGIWTRQEFVAALERLQKFAETEEDGQNQLRLFSASAHEVRQDRSGRVMIPASHREAAKLQKDVVVCGAASRVEIWNPENWKQLTKDIGQSRETWL